MRAIRAFQEYLTGIPWNSISPSCRSMQLKNECSSLSRQWCPKLSLDLACKVREEWIMGWKRCTGQKMISLEFSQMKRMHEGYKKEEERVQERGGQGGNHEFIIRINSKTCWLWINLAKWGVFVNLFTQYRISASIVNTLQTRITADVISRRNREWKQQWTKLTMGEKKWKTKKLIAPCSLQVSIWRCVSAIN